MSKDIQLTWPQRGVLSYIKEHGSISLSEVQVLGDILEYAANSILRPLIEQQVIVKITTLKNERGRFNEYRYGPGPKFPARNEEAR